MQAPPGSSGGPVTSSRGGATLDTRPALQRREATARSLLTLQWAHPVWHDPREDERVEGRTYAGGPRKPLPREEAFAAIADGDDRPLLVLRECDACKGSDDALLSSRLDNEKTLLMASWFRLVKLPGDVLVDDHPFRNLFEQEQPCHLFLADAEGTVVLPLSGQQSQTELWDAMGELLQRTSRDDPEDVVQDMYAVLDALDEADRAELAVRRQLEQEAEGTGRSSKLKTLQRELAQHEERRAELMERFRTLAALRPRTR